MDTCEAVTRAIIKAVEGLSNPLEADYCRKDEPCWTEMESVYKFSTSDKASVKSHHTKSSARSGYSRCSSNHSSQLSIKRQEAAAEVTASKAALEVLKQIQREEAEITEQQRQIDAKRREVERLQAVKKLEAAKARQQVYEQSVYSDDEIRKLLHPDEEESEGRSEPKVLHFQHNLPPQPSPQLPNATDLVKAFAE